MLTQPQIDASRDYANTRAYDGTLEEWLAAFSWYARQLVAQTGAPHGA